MDCTFLNQVRTIVASPFALGTVAGTRLPMLDLEVLAVWWEGGHLGLGTGKGAGLLGKTRFMRGPDREGLLEA